MINALTAAPGNMKVFGRQDLSKYWVITLDDITSGHIFNMLPGGGNSTYRLHAYAEDVDGQVTLLGTRTFTASNSTAALPFGAIDTPGQGETVSGVITNWGWALTPQPGNIPVDGSTPSYLYQGKTYYFCSEECRAAFAKNPKKYAGP